MGASFVANPLVEVISSRQRNVRMTSDPVSMASATASVTADSASMTSDPSPMTLNLAPMASTPFH